jgi:hypothetical protein
MSNITEKLADRYQILALSLERPSQARHTRCDSEWTPRLELYRWLSRRIRDWHADVRLMLSVVAAVTLGGDARCNLAMDSVLMHEEGGSKPC